MLRLCRLHHLFQQFRQANRASASACEPRLCPYIMSPSRRFTHVSIAIHLPIYFICRHFRSAALSLFSIVSRLRGATSYSQSCFHVCPLHVFLNPSFRDMRTAPLPLHANRASVVSSFPLSFSIAADGELGTDQNKFPYPWWRIRIWVNDFSFLRVQISNILQIEACRGLANPRILGFTIQAPLAATAAFLTPVY